MEATTSSPGDPEPSVVEIRQRVSTSKTRFCWSLDKYSTLRRVTKACICSNQFRCGGLAWKVMLYPRGSPEVNRETTSAFLVPVAQPPRPVDTAYKFVFNGHETPEDTHQFTSAANWGFHDAVPDTILMPKLASNSDRLDLVVHLEVLDPLTTIGAVPDPLEEPSTLVDDFGALLSGKHAFSDVVFTFKSGKLHAHRVILAARSSVFRSMFSSGMQESSSGEVMVMISDIDKRLFQEMLRYMYTGQFTPKIVMEHTVDLLMAADKYDVRDLCAVCEKVLLQGVTKDNVSSLLSMAQDHRLLVLKEQLLAYIADNFVDEVLTDSFRQLVVDSPDLVAQAHSTVAARVSGVSELRSSSFEPAHGPPQPKSKRRGHG
eukprot:TRINITY_DN16500_c0_g1_i1.p1 TRINITY_DN16500_c0_g1~~TRINITY_DN16500_c0_g1_i1.p1  ORF type:complete len:374 (-),score=92.75 TRINITY_DN16500_c0_g1_i1:152-1273(-)